MRSKAADFFRENIFRLILLSLMLTTIGFFIAERIKIFFIYYTDLFIQNGVLGFIVNIVMIFPILIPIILLIGSLVSHRKDAYLPRTGIEIACQISLVIFKTALYILFIGLISIAAALILYLSGLLPYQSFST